MFVFFTRNDGTDRCSSLFSTLYKYYKTREKKSKVEYQKPVRVRRKNGSNGGARSEGREEGWGSWLFRGPAYVSS